MTNSGRSRLTNTPIVYESQKWEYRCLVRDPLTDELLSEEELNELGKEGWLLSGVIKATDGSGGEKVYFYLTRSTY